MTSNVTRRHLLGTILAGTAATACNPEPQITQYTAGTEASKGEFAHGVASGDPDQVSAVIWTRITPNDPTGGPVNVTYEVALDDGFQNIVTAGEISTRAARDWTVKVVADGLSADQAYVYRFRTNTAISPTGHLRTLPAGDIDEVKFAVVSCANFQHGYFNVYDHISRQDDIAAMIHLGDYIYEYGAEQILGTPYADMGRLHEPRHETVTLEDYRLRHAQYRTDASLQAVTAKMPMIAIWDDHEITNDSWRGGAQNHQEDEGPWDARKEAALRAYYEWMPVRDPEPGRLAESLYRTFEWGNLLTMTAVETRLLARDQQIDLAANAETIKSGGYDTFRDEVIDDPSRDMLGEQQLNFIVDSFRASKMAGKPWRILANQVVMGRVLTPDLTPHVDEDAIAAIETEWDGIRNFVELSKYRLPVYPDSWDGYPAAREKLYTALDAAGINDMLVITGDAHEFWINDLTKDDGTPMGAEVGTSSVSSQTLAAFLGEASADYALLMTQSNPDVRFYNLLHHGYVELTVTPQFARAELKAVDNVTSPEYGIFDLAEFTIRPTKTSLDFSAPKGLNLKQRALFNGLG